MDDIFRVGDRVRCIDLLPNFRRPLEWVKNFRLAFKSENEFFDNEHIIARIDPKQRYLPIILAENGIEVGFSTAEIRKAEDVNNLPLFDTRLRIWLVDDHVNRITGKIFEWNDDHILFWSEDGAGITRVERAAIRAAARVEAKE